MQYVKENNKIIIKAPELKPVMPFTVHDSVGQVRLMKCAGDFFLP